MCPSPLVLFVVAASASAVELRPVASPVALSDVTLTGDWADKQQRNREVLMSLNVSRWACHFTTTANLTACRSVSVPWHTYVRMKNGTFVHKLGFLALGDDAKPEASLDFNACEAACEALTTCAAITFQSDAATPITPVKCYFKTTAAHFTPTKRTANCVAHGGPGMPVCEPLPGEMGLGGYYGHYQGHWLSAMAFLVNNTANATVKARADHVIDILASVMHAWHAKYGDDRGDGYLFPYDVVVWDKLLSGHGAYPYYSVPFYTLHKLMAGLLDQHVFAGSTKARAHMCMHMSYACIHVICMCMRIRMSICTSPYLT